jgi:hypothetical protein
MRANALFIVGIIPMLAFAGESNTTWVGPHALSMPKISPTIAAGLHNYMQQTEPEKTIPVIVFFTDKGIYGEDQYEQALLTTELNLTEASRLQRMKSRGPDNLVDFRDIPVHGPYVEDVLAFGANLRHPLKWFNAVSVDATPEQIETIAALDAVRFVKMVAASRVDYDVNFTPVPPQMQLFTLDYGPSEGQLNQINVIPAHELGFKGQGILVCMMDTGYRQGHDAFQNIIDSGRLIAQHDFVFDDDDTDFDPDQDVDGQANHGTLTWSTLGGEASGELYGPSYLANFVLCKTEDIGSERHIEEDNWAAAALWVDSLGASVISASLGYRWFDSGQGDYSCEVLNGDSTIVTKAADLAAYNGIAVATAMGNSGDADCSLVAPADGDSVIGCGAVDASGIIAGFSSRGPTGDGRTKPEVCAQGVSTVCANPNNFQDYSTASGTSLSTPLIGGACGVILSAHPNWGPVMVREALMMTASRAESPDNDYGWGIADVIRAIYYHPEGDIVFEHEPVLAAPINQSIDFNVNITGGAGITSATLFWRNGTSGGFNQVAMSQNGSDFSAQISGQSGSVLQYYYKATDNLDIFAYEPLGDSSHPFSFGLGVTEFIDSVDHGLQYWESGGTQDFWGLSAKYANSGALSITESTSGNYRNNTDSFLKSRFSLDLTDANSASFSFYWRGLMESSHDTLFVEVSIDGGNNWARLPQFISASGFSFAQYSADLSSYLGNSDVRLRFHFKSDGAGVREGLYIDDIVIDWATTGIDDNVVTLPENFRLEQNYPNPFNPSTKISFYAPVSARIELSIFDLLGRKVRTLLTSDVVVGPHDITWDGKDDSGLDMSSGVYVYRLQSGKTSVAKRMTLVR